MENPPPILPQLQKILGKSLEDAKKIANTFGYRLEVFIPKTEVDVWGEEKETGWITTSSRYAPDKLNVELDENGNVNYFDY